MTEARPSPLSTALRVLGGSRSRKECLTPSPDAAQPANECDLARQARAGDPNALATLFHRHDETAAHIVREALASFGFESDTPDVLQSARISAYRSIATLRDDCCFRAWYWTIARRKALSHARGRVREQLRDDENGYDRDAGRGPDPFEHLQALQLLDQVLQNLAARQRRALVLWLLDGMSYREIAAEMNITPGTVGKTLHDARDRTSVILRTLGIHCTPTSGAR